MKFDASITIVGIITITSLVSPWVTTYMNNKHQLKLKEWDYKEFQFKNETIYIRNLCEKFMDNVGLLVYSRVISSSPYQNLSRSYYSLLPYIPSEKIDTFNKLINLINSEQRTPDQENEIHKLLKEDILPTIKKISNK